MLNSKLIEKTEDFGQYISPARDKETPLYNWHAFKHSYSKELVEKLLDEFDLKRGSWVLDSFCGGGTTLLSCKESGINASGFDILPFSVFLSNVKTRTYDTTKLRIQLKNFEDDGNLKFTSLEFPDIDLIKKAFNEDVKTELLSLKEKIDRIRDPYVRDFYTLGLLSILESVSNTVKSGGFLRISERKVNADEVYPKFNAKVAQMIQDYESFYDTLKYKNAKIIAKTGDSRKLPTDRKFNAVITSPPYPNRHDYTRIYGLEMIFNFVDNNDQLKKIRYNTLRSHVEAKKQFEPKGYKKPSIISDIIADVEVGGPNNSKVTEMIEGYFEDMYLSLSQMQKRLKAKGKIALVVSNVRFCGVNVPVDEILADIGEQAGLTTQNIYIARYRGNSSQQMKKYKRKPSRESIIIWHK
ncbi:MAG: DNA methyltransferase [Candidatus Altiarchaeia archaeon]